MDQNDIMQSGNGDRDSYRLGLEESEIGEWKKITGLLSWKQTTFSGLD